GMLIEYLLNRARPILFSTSHPPAVTAANLAAIDVLEQEPERIERLWDNARFFKRGLADLGLNTGASETPITPVITAESSRARDGRRRLARRGIAPLGRCPRGPARPWDRCPRERAIARCGGRGGHDRRSLLAAAGTVAPDRHRQPHAAAQPGSGGRLLRRHRR